MDLDKVDSDNNERPSRSDFDDRFGRNAVERAALDEDFRLPGLTISLAFGDAPREDDVFKVEDREVVILEFVGGVNGDDVVQGTNQIANAGNGQLRHSFIVPVAFPWCCRRPKIDPPMMVVPIEN